MASRRQQHAAKISNPDLGSGIALEQAVAPKNPEMVEEAGIIEVKARVTEDQYERAHKSRSDF